MRRSPKFPPRFRAALAAALAVALFAALAGPSLARADAGEWRLVPSESEVVFEYESDGQPARGTFGEFSGEGRFRPDDPGAATLELRIRSDSIDLGDARANAFATSAEWFDSANHPNLVYQLRKLTHLEANRYRAIGDLTVRGRSRPVTTTITLEVGARHARASGTLTVNRKDYGLGVGPSALFVEIGPEVSVRFELTARPEG